MPEQVPADKARYRRDTLPLWSTVLTERLTALGFKSVSEFMYIYDQASTVNLVKQLSIPEIASMQLERAFMEEARSSGAQAIERCARNLLARDLINTLPQGWPACTDRAQSADARLLYSVFTSLAYSLPIDCETACEAVRLAMFVAPIAQGWRPVDGDDPLLVGIFRDHWRPS